MSVDKLPQRDDAGHKATFGTVAVVGGSERMLGAPCFVATAALRTGAGVVRLAVPEALVLSALALVPSAMAAPIGGDVDAWLKSLAADAVLAVGCGWGQSDDRRDLLRAMLASPYRLVLDADGLNLLATLPDEILPRRAPLVLTPHPGEHQRLASAWGLPLAGSAQGERILAAIALAQRARAVVVLKGAGTVVTDGHTTTVDPSRNAALAIPGSGDVLTGIVAGLLAQGLDTLRAARLAVRLHGKAGELWRERVGPSGLLAMELAALVPEAMRFYCGEQSWQEEP